MSQTKTAKSQDSQALRSITFQRVGAWQETYQESTQVNVDENNGSCSRQASHKLQKTYLETGKPQSYRTQDDKVDRSVERGAPSRIKTKVNMDSNHRSAVEYYNGSGIGNLDHLRLMRQRMISNILDAFQHVKSETIVRWPVWAELTRPNYEGVGSAEAPRRASGGDVNSAKGRKDRSSALPPDAIAANGGEQRSYSRGYSSYSYSLGESPGAHARTTPRFTSNEGTMSWTAHTPSAEGFQSGGTRLAYRVRRLGNSKHTVPVSPRYCLEMVTCDFAINQLSLWPPRWTETGEKANIQKAKQFHVSPVHHGISKYDLVMSYQEHK
ncbi:hypothetical protein JB92DRAFT_2826742 [Gautieria morchelliformis]|nr:hypothetical protein JB92DRAFT_2826742 [Gautieria morchelliformis]